MKDSMRSNDRSKRRAPAPPQNKVPTHGDWLGSSTATRTPKQAPSKNQLAQAAAARSYGVPNIHSASQLPTYASRPAPVPKTTLRPPPPTAQTKPATGGGFSSLWSSRPRAPPVDPKRQAKTPPAISRKPVPPPAKSRSQAPPAQSGGFMSSLRGAFVSPKTEYQAYKRDSAEKKHNAKKAGISGPKHHKGYNYAASIVSKPPAVATSAPKLNPVPQKGGIGPKLFRSSPKPPRAEGRGTMVGDFMTDRSPAPIPGNTPFFHRKKTSSDLSFACQGWQPSRPGPPVGSSSSPRQGQTQWCQTCGRSPARAPSRECRMCATEHLAYPPSIKPVPPLKDTKGKHFIKQQVMSPPLYRGDPFVSPIFPKKSAAPQPPPRPLPAAKASSTKTKTKPKIVTTRQGAEQHRLNTLQALCGSNVHVRSGYGKEARVVRAPSQPQPAQAKISFAGDRDTNFYRFYDDVLG